MKTISIKQIQHQAQEMQGWEGCYKGVALSEIIADLKQAYKEDGYKIVK